MYTDDRRPVFMPLWNYACNQGGPNPDYVYSTIQVDPNGVYEISGYRGTSRFVEITQQEDEIRRDGHLGPRPARRSRPPTISTSSPSATTARSASILSAERPAGYAGDWWPLDPRPERLLMRKCACDWNNEIDARVAINRLDDPGRT